MNQELVAPQDWRRRRWLALIALVFATQLGLIFWLGKTGPAVPPFAELAPSLRLVGASAAQLLTLTDPTLFALPHREGFSGPAWLTISEQPYQPFEWSEPPRWLALPQDQLGDEFAEFMVTNLSRSLPTVAQTEFEFLTPFLVETEALPQQSTLRVTGPLANRRLLITPALPSMPGAELLTNSVVQLIVAANGTPRSATLLKTKNSPTEPDQAAADQFALREARHVLFEPANVRDGANPLADVSWGKLVFEWRTLPLPATNKVLVPSPGK